MALDTTIGGLESNSYVTVEFADAYIQANLDADDWSTLNTSQKEQILVKAALMLEDYKFSGDRTVVGQALAFPRINLFKYEDLTQPVAFNVVPYQIKNAQCELALWMFLSRGVDEYSSVNMAGLSVSKGFETDKNSTDIPEIVFVLIKPFFKNLVNSAMISVSRAYADSVVTSTPREPSISGVATFIGLMDTPNSYLDASGMFVKVNDAGTALEFSSEGGVGTVSWGDIEGLLSSQTDLQDALDTKLEASPALAAIINTGDGNAYLANDGTYKTISASGGGTWGSITGTLADQTDLSTALGLKADAADLHTHSNKPALDAVVNSGNGTLFLANDGLYKAVGEGSGTATWGGILGTLSDQSDLQTALNNKADDSDLHEHTNKTLLDTIISSGTGANFLADDGTYKEVSAGSSVISWGDIEGTLADQVDLKSVIDLKADATDIHTHADLVAVEKVIDSGDGTVFLANDGTYKGPAWGSITGLLVNQTDLQTALDAKSETTHTHSELHTHANSTLLSTITSAGDGTYFLANDGSYKVIEAGTNTVPFTAKEAITLGSWVALNDDNTVSLVISTPDGVSKGTPVAFESTMTTLRHSIASLTATKFVIACTSDTGIGKLYVGDVSGTTISFGSATAVPGASNTGFLKISALSATTFIASYADGSDSTKGAYVVGTVSGTTISFGTENNTVTAYVADTWDVCALTSTSFAALYKVGSDLKVAIGTLSGTTITMNTAVVVSSSTTNDVQIKKLTDSKFVIKYVDGGPDGWCRVGTVSGTTITLYTAAMYQDNYTYYSEMDALSATRVVCASRTGSSYTGSVYVGTVNADNTITFGTANTVVASGDYKYSVVATSSSTAAIFYSSTSGYAASVRIAYISSTNTVTFNTAYSVSTSARHFSGVIMDGKITACYTDPTDGSKGKGIIINPALQNTDRKIGIAQNTVAAAGTVNVVLTDGSLYEHPTGDGNLHVPATGTTNNGKVLTAGAIAGSISWEDPTGGSGAAADDTAYSATTWDSSLLAPTQNAVRDKFVTVDASISTKASISGVETLTNKTLTGISETATTVAASGGTLTLNCATTNLAVVALDQNIVSIVFNNVPSTGKAYGITLKFTVGSTARTITWPSSVKWSAGVAPTLSTISGLVDVFVLFTHDGGTTWYAFVAGQAME